MNDAKSQLIVDVLKEALAADECLFVLNAPADDDPGVEIDGGPGLFEEACVFDHTSDETAAEILKSFLSVPLNVGWELRCELAKLLVKRGHLVTDLVEPIIQGDAWVNHPAGFLALASLATAPDGESRVLELLDTVPEDSRDGLFLACWWLDSRPVDRKLILKFTEWGNDPHWTPCATGEIGALWAFTKRWLGKYPYTDLEGVVRAYFEQGD